MLNIFLPFLAACALVFTGCKTTQRQQESPAADVNFETANQYAQDGLYREAMASYQKVLTRDPNNFTAHRNLGMVLVKVGHYKKATQHLEKSLAQYNENYEANFYLAESYRAREKYADAIFRYKKSLEAKPNDQKTLKALSWSYYKIRYYTEALRIIKELKGSADEGNEIAIITARILLKINRPEKALAVIHKAEALAKKSELPYLQSVEGDIQRATGDMDKAVEAYTEALKSQPLLAGALLGLGQALLPKDKKNQEKALSYMERAIRVKPRYPEALYALGKAYESIDADKSMKYYKMFRKIANADPEFLDEMYVVKSRLDMKAVGN
ncbi:MAG: tetratricopeptide repeat protein [Oligoflexales bacterium]